MKKQLKDKLVSSLWRSAAAVLANDQPTVVAVTGSVGKTTSKEAIAHLLSEGPRPVVASVGNMNTEISVPLVICGQRKIPRRPWQWASAWLSAHRAGQRRGILAPETILVLEFASEKKGDMAFLAERVPVDVAAFTLFSPSHLSLDTKVVKKEKQELLRGVGSKGVVVVNADDPEQQDLCGDRRAITYGYSQQAQVRLTQVKGGAAGVRGEIVYRGATYPFTSRLVGKHQAMSIALAVAVGVKLGYSPKQLIERASTLASQPGRLRLIEGRKSITIIDDTYNSSPAAAVAALDALVSLRQKGRRLVAVMGNMNALGRGTVAAHLELGRRVAEHKVDYFIAIGPNAHRMVKGARDAGMPDQHLIEFETPERLMGRLDNLLQSGDIVLVKASQDGMKLERIVKLLMAHPEQAKKELVRQY